MQLVDVAVLTLQGFAPDKQANHPIYDLRSAGFLDIAVSSTPPRAVYRCHGIDQKRKKKDRGFWGGAAVARSLTLPLTRQSHSICYISSAR
ncbi:hypothetical protein SKAU_G00119010 [Synaphobranchus kaupii]|uniref:Uncharacterized protein n=1 Tax=Synaphobranchus kaupii TaxID=118154 RepID=A0A9Q1FN78_SYNKA|nr:hypothetical protein SKAU_G00119010 [Synaphobranchus kaupii]